MFPEGRILDFVIVGVVALIVVGPKDLPLLMRKVGQFVARLRGMAAEFRASFDEMARQSELDELRREVEAMRAGQPLRAVALGGDAAQVLDDIQAGLKSGEAQLHLPLWQGNRPVVGSDPEVPQPETESAGIHLEPPVPESPDKAAS